MKLISSIRKGLAKIDGALEVFPPHPGYEGSQEALKSARTIWWGENSITSDADNFINSDAEPQFHPEDVDAEDSGVDGVFGGFDPVLEIAADVDERFPGLGGEEGKKIHQSVLLHGMDALGWYASFHNPGLQWGIYIPISGIVYLIKHAFGDLSAPLETKAHLAFHAILNHELFHFATDYAIAQAELAHQEPWYVPAKKAFRDGNPKYCVEEEQLANAYMLSAFRSMKPALRVRGKQAALRAFVEKQPEGYRDAVSVKPLHWDRLLETLAHRFGERTGKSASHPALWYSSLGFDWPRQFPIRPRIDWRYCPIHLIDDSERLGIPPGWLSFFSRLSGIHETDEFRKKLDKLAPPVQRAWARTRQKLGNSITTGLDFKKWDRGVDDLYSVRINDNFRAHLQRPRGSGYWLAVAIGYHKEMGLG